MDRESCLPPAKLAHYSVPMQLLAVLAATDRNCAVHRSVDGRCRRHAGALLAAALLCGHASLASAANQKETDARRAEAQLQAVKAEIQKITRQVSEEQVERDRLTRELRSAEVSVGKAREGLDSVRRDRVTLAGKRVGVVGQKHAREVDLQRNRGALAEQL